MADVGTDVFRHKGAAIIWRTMTRFAHREEYRELSLCVDQAGDHTRRFWAEIIESCQAKYID